MYSRTENLDVAGVGLGGSGVVGFGGTGLVVVVVGLTAPPAVMPID